MHEQASVKFTLMVIDSELTVAQKLFEITIK